MSNQTNQSPTLREMAGVAGPTDTGLDRSGSALEMLLAPVRTTEMKRYQHPVFSACELTLRYFRFNPSIE